MNRELQIVPWKEFLSWPFSERTRSFFFNAEITHVEQLTEKTEQELVRYRGVGLKVVMEIREALAHHGLTIADDLKPDQIRDGQDLDALLREQVKLGCKLREIKAAILRLKSLKNQKDKMAPSVFARWLELKDYNAVAKEFALPTTKVSSIVSAAFRRRLKTGELDGVEIFHRWEKVKNYALVAKEYDVPEFLVRHVVLKFNTST